MACGRRRPAGAARGDPPAQPGRRRGGERRGAQRPARPARPATPRSRRCRRPSLQAELEPVALHRPRRAAGRQEFLDEYLRPCSRAHARSRPRPAPPRCGYDDRTRTRARCPCRCCAAARCARSMRSDAERLLLVASDRVSAFDVVMGEAGARTRAPCSPSCRAFWFEHLDTAVAVALRHGRHAAKSSSACRRWRATATSSPGRAMLVRRTEPVPFECVVRGYLAGSAWAEYKAQGTLAGEPLPQGLLESARLEPPLFSPATKAESGPRRERHLRRMVAQALGADAGRAPARRQLRASTRPGATTPRAAGIIIADTKFEFGHARRRHAAPHRRGADARFAPASGPPTATRRAAASRASTSSRCATISRALRQAGSWNGEAPPPPLPAEVVEATSRALPRGVPAAHRPRSGGPA